MIFLLDGFFRFGEKKRAIVIIAVKTLLTSALTHSLTHSLTLTRTHSLTHSLTNSHSLTITRHNINIVSSSDGKCDCNSVSE